MHKGLCRREEGCGGQRRRWHEWHCVACKSRKGSLVATTTAAAAAAAAAAADAAAAHNILDNTPSLLLNPQILAEIGKDRIVWDGDIGGMVPRKGLDKSPDISYWRGTYRPRMNSSESFFTSSFSTISESQRRIAPFPSEQVKSGSRSMAVLTFPSACLVKIDRDEHFARRCTSFSVLIFIGRANCSTATVRRFGFSIKDRVYSPAFLWPSVAVKTIRAVGKRAPTDRISRVGVLGAGVFFWVPARLLLSGSESACQILSLAASGPAGEGRQDIESS